MWSTTVARVRCLGSPGGYRAAHSRQNGSRRSCAGRRSSVQTGRLYQRWYFAEARRGAFCGLCLGQYPSRVRAPHPGCRHGRSGFRARAITSRQTKKRPSHDTRSIGSSSAQALVSTDAGSGASIFTTVSCPHRLHLQGRFRAVVSARSFSSLPLRHTGQITHPSFTISLPQRALDCKPFRPLFFLFYR